MLPQWNKSNIKERVQFVFVDAPEIETKGKWVHTGLGVESQLMCNVHAHPHAKVTWMKDEKEVIPKKGSIEIKGNKTRHILEILHTEKEHLGNYTCIAQNKLGRAEKTISLTGMSFFFFSITRKNLKNEIKHVRERLKLEIFNVQKFENEKDSKI